METKKLSIIFFFGLVLVAGFFLIEPAYADWEGWCLGGVGPGCHHTPPPPPPPPEIKAFCDGKKPKKSFEYRTPCADINNLKYGELVTIEGYNFTPDSHSFETVIRAPNGVAYNTAPTPYPEGAITKADGNGRFTLVIMIPDSSNKPELLPPGNYPLGMKLQRPYSRAGEGYEIASVNLNIVANPVSLPPQLKPEPPPSQPQPTPPKQEEKTTVKKIPLTLKSLELSYGAGYTSIPEAVPPLIKKGVAVKGYPLIFGIEGFHRSNRKGTDTMYDIFIDGNLVKKDVRIGWLATYAEINFKIVESIFDVGKHTFKIVCTNCPFPGGIMYTSDRDGGQYVGHAGYDVEQSGEFDFEVALPPPNEEITAPKQNEMHIGDKFIISGKNFVPGVSVPSISLVAIESGDEITINPQLKNAVVQLDTTFIASFEVPQEASRLVKGRGLVKIVGQGTSSSFGNTLRYRWPTTPDNSYTLIASCVLKGEAKITPRGSAAVNLFGEYPVFNLENFYCHDPITVNLRMIGFDKNPFKIYGSALRNFDYKGKAILAVTAEDGTDGKIDLRARELEIQVKDNHNNSVQVGIKIVHPYSFVADPILLKAGESFFVRDWRGFANNTKVTVSLDGERLRSVYLDPKDPPEITIPKGTAKGRHTIEVSNTFLFGLVTGGKAIEDIEIYEGGDKEKAEKEKEMEQRKKAGVEAKFFGNETTKKYGEEKVNTGGEIEGKKFGDVETKKYDDIQTKTYGDLETKSYGDVKTKTYSDIETKKYGESTTTKYGDIQTKIYSDLETKSYGDATTTKYGDVQAKTYGDIQTKTYGDSTTTKYGDVQTKIYGDVQAPIYETPQTAPGECNPTIPTYAQPGCKKPSSSLKGKSSFFAGLFDNVRLFFMRTFYREQKTKFLPASEPTKKISEANSKIIVNQSDLSVEPLPTAKQIISKTAQEMTGSYRCWSYNVSGGGGGNCRLFAPIILKKDGTYSISAESGTFKITGDIIIFSESKIRGPGTIIDNNKIKFEYDYNGWHHTITYLKEEGVSVSDANVDIAKSENKFVEITLHIIFPKGDYSADSVNVTTLYIKDTKEQVAQSLTYALDRQTVETWFGKRPPKEGLMTGKVYDIFVSSGFSEWKAGELDLREVSADTTITINALTQ